MFPADKKRVEEALSACHLPNGKVRVSLVSRSLMSLRRIFFPALTGMLLDAKTISQDAHSCLPYPATARP